MDAILKWPKYWPALKASWHEVWVNNEIRTKRIGYRVLTAESEVFCYHGNKLISKGTNNWVHASYNYCTELLLISCFIVPKISQKCQWELWEVRETLISRIQATIYYPQKPSQTDFLCMYACVTDFALKGNYVNSKITTKYFWGTNTGAI